MSERTRSRILLALALLMYAGLAGARALADRPVVDEAWFGSPAMNLSAHGSLHTSILESKGTFFEGLNRYTFWILPAYLVVLAGWFEIAGASLFAMRALSILFGCGVIVAAYVLVHRLVRDRTQAGLAALLVAIDFAVVRAGAVGRMDGMCAAFGLGGIALYLSLRERSTRTAFLAGNALTAISVFTHPNGVLYFGGLMVTAFWWDRARLRVSHLALGAVPYLALFAAWGAYIANDAGMFLRQFGGNASDRFAGALAPIEALRREIYMRYLGVANIVDPLAIDVQTALRFGLLLPYAIGVTAACAIRPLRTHEGVQPLLALVLLFFVYQWLLDAVKLHFYAVHLTPLCMSLFAIVLVWAWRHTGWRLAVGAAAVPMILLQLAGTAYTIRRNSYDNAFSPVVDRLRPYEGDGHLIMGSSELAFGLGFDANLIDDVRLGYHNGRASDVIVLDRRYRESFVLLLGVEEPDALRHVNEVLEHYRRIFQWDDYEVLLHRGLKHREPVNGLSREAGKT